MNYVSYDMPWLEMHFKAAGLPSGYLCGVS